MATAPQEAKMEYDKLPSGAKDDAVEKGQRHTTDVTQELLSTGNVASAVDDLVQDHPVMMFSKPWCPFCLELKRTLEVRGVAYSVAELSLLEGDKMAAAQDKLLDLGGMRTVPHLFLNGRSFQGCRDTKKLEHSGELDVVLAEFVPRDFVPPPDEPRLQHNAFLWFPDTVNNNVIRGGSILTVITCALSIAFYKNDATPYVILGLAIDFLLRLCAGAAVSPLGMLTVALVSHLPPKRAAGPPKQFAAFCGVCLSTWAAGFFLAGQDLAGAIILGALTGAASLEAFFGFCLGCFIFNHGIRLGLVPANVYRPHLNLVDAKTWAYDWSHTYRELPKVQNTRVMLPGQTHPTAADLMRKDHIRKESKFEDVDVVRHMKSQYFCAPMALAALALVFHFIHVEYPVPASPDDTRGGWLDEGVSDAFTIIATILLAACLLLYALRMVVAPQKCLKDLRHPEKSGGFTCLFITLMLLAIVVVDDGAPDASQALLWLGAAPQMLFTVVRMSDLVHERHFEVALGPMAMITPVGNLVAALALGIYAGADGAPSDVDYQKVAHFYFGVGTLFAVTLFVISFRKAVVDHWSDVRSRTSVWVWLATSSLLAPALVATSPLADPTGVFRLSLFGISVFLLLLLGDGCRRGFYHTTDSRANFIYAFSLSAFALAAFQIYVAEGGRFTYGLAIAAVAAATTVTAVCVLHLLAEALGGTLFTPGDKWSPLSFTLLTHEAFRFGLPKAGKLIAAMDPEKPGSIRAAEKALSEVCFAMEEHTRQEDAVFFPYVRRFFPELGLELDDEHESLHKMLDMFTETLKEFTADGLAAKPTAFLQENYDAWVAQVLAHSRHEETLLGPVLRKYMPSLMQKDLLEDVWKFTSGPGWQRLLPFTLNNLPSPGMQVRYIKTFCWAMPERCQEVGLIVYRHVDSARWVFLATHIPEMIPRGVPGHKRIF